MLGRSVVGERNCRLTETNAHARYEDLTTPTTSFVQARRNLACPRASERVSECDRASVHVRPVERQPEVVNHVAVHGRERLVDLPEVDVVLRDAGALEHFRDRDGWSLLRRRVRVRLSSDRAGQEKEATYDTHDAGRQPSDRSANVLSEDLEPQLLGLPPRHEEDTRDTVRDLRRVSSGRRTVAPLRERRLDLGELLLGRTGADSVVLRDASLDTRRSRTARRGRSCGREDERVDRKDFGVEETGRLGLLGTLLRQRSEFVHAFARDVEICTQSGKLESVWNDSEMRGDVRTELTFGDVLRSPSHGVLRVLCDGVGENIGGKRVGTLWNQRRDED